MYRIFLRVLLVCALLMMVPAGFFTLSGESSPTRDDCRELYDGMGLQGVVNYKAFALAVRGMAAFGDVQRGVQRDILTLIDFTKPSTEERFYVFNLKERKIVFCSLVAHGRNSGGNYATSFSNTPGSYKSSPGFYLTGQTYMGGNGYSLTLDGLEKGINDKARQRAIVIHGADYCSEKFIASNGRLGRSWGCPALPREIAREVIDSIKGGSLLCIYAEDKEYLAHSEVAGRQGQAVM